MTDQVEAFDPVTRSWSARRPLPRPRGGVNAVNALGLLHVFGGEGNAASATGVFPDHDVYDPTRDLWIHLADMPTPVHGVTGASFLRGLIHLPGGGLSMGGASGSLTHQVYRPRSAY